MHLSGSLLTLFLHVLSLHHSTQHNLYDFSHNVCGSDMATFDYLCRSSSQIGFTLCTENDLELKLVSNDSFHFNDKAFMTGNRSLKSASHALCLKVDDL